MLFFGWSCLFTFWASSVARFARIEKILFENTYCNRKKKKKLLKLENQAVAKNERVRILWSIYWQPITYYKWNGNTKVNQKDSFDFMMTRDYI